MLVSPRRVELLFSGWKPDVLTDRRRGQNHLLTAVLHVHLGLTVRIVHHSKCYSKYNPYNKSIFFIRGSLSDRSFMGRITHSIWIFYAENTQTTQRMFNLSVFFVMATNTCSGICLRQISIWCARQRVQTSIFLVPIGLGGIFGLAWFTGHVSL